MDGQDIFDSATRRWACANCGRPRSFDATCQQQLCRLPSMRSCAASSEALKITLAQVKGNGQAVDPVKAEAEREQQRWLTENGCGAHLHRLIKRWTGEDIEPGCGCSSRIAEMNARGPGWCRENVDIIVDWLIEEIDRRLKLAKDEGESVGWRLRIGGIGLPGRRFVLRWIVLVAVQRAERKITV